MSVEAMAMVLHHSRAKGTAKLVLLGIANHQGDGGAWPAVGTLARYANVTERNVQKALQQLVNLGELLVELQAGGDRDKPDHERPNRYDVTVTCPSWCDRSTNHRDKRGKPLRITGVGFDTPPLSIVTPRPLSPATPKPPTQPDPTSVGTQPQERPVPCVTCHARSRTHCEARQRKLHVDDRHPYEPRPERASG